MVRINSLEGWPPGWQRVLAWPLGWLRRSRHDPWFALMATIDCQKPEQRLREGQSYVAPKTGEMVCYFNDLPWMYRNNGGGVTLNIVPSSSPPGSRNGKSNPETPGPKRTHEPVIRKS